ncbi:hypothetical protein HanXRQr2_Chr14g0634221 [Helianthus annuus]|uniref:Uncharacterized protein n=1 Tax=Helianthus annuus TaxID=4232 RepID=A0A9K3H7P8_HELAN|nr:hypothetical protein HanXRQr2_Chr14g0634221 [Helianthus annuus]KAJ0839556.1 hypothetical protein HanPSC8_Chr14g0608251 [Helianthus annuus]
MIGCCLKTDQKFVESSLIFVLSSLSQSRRCREHHLDSPNRQTLVLVSVAGDLKTCLESVKSIASFTS